MLHRGIIKPEIVQSQQKAHVIAIDGDTPA